ncbi:MAG TPA: CARDB domain-containing protein [Solirubrobacterales bacterium]
MVRRAVAAGVGVLILILLVLGVRGCLNARKERSFENYVSDLSSIAAETQNLSQQFFKRLQDPGGLSALEFEAEVKADRGAMEGLLDRAEGLDAPDELAEAQDLIVLSYELRRDALAAISELLPVALGDSGADKAIQGIAEEMRTFLASDVLYTKGQEQIEEELTAQEIAYDPETEPISTQFLPAEPNWLDPDEVSGALGGASSTSDEDAAPGLHGLGLVEGGVILQPTGAALADGVPVTAAADGAELEIQVENQGDNDESDVVVSYELQGGGSGEETIDEIAAGEIATVNVPVEAAAGDTGELTVSVEPVPGEEIEENNTLTTEVTFE